MVVMRCALLALVLLASDLAGCSRPATAPTSTEGAAIEWQGVMPCVDCTAIQVDLVLRNENGRRRYELTEVYLDAGGGSRFVEPGDWQRSRALLRLRGDGGSLRVFALLPDGRLESRDRHGRRSAAGTRSLLPVAISRTEPAPTDTRSP
jgi:hypothetical protein